jgi:hypothetical protein
MAPPDIRRALRADQSSDPIISFDLNEYLTLSFDFNFGDGNKELLFGLHFDFNSGIETEKSIQNLMRSFLNDTIGDKGGDELGEFSFAGTALELANDLIESLVIGISVKIDIQFGLDLGNMFNKTATSRLPSPFLKLNTFDVDGHFGVNEWSTKLDLNVSASEFELRITEARALFSIKAGIIGDTPLWLESPKDFFSIISPTSGNGIRLNASLDVLMPVFVTLGDLGFGATIRYTDDNVLDNVTKQPSFDPDVLISIDLIKHAASTLKNNTAFLRKYEPLQQMVPLLRVSVNDLIAGQGRTLADCFDLTKFADELLGKQIASGMPSSSPSTSENPSAIPSDTPSASPTAIPTQAPTSFPTATPTTATPTSSRPTLPIMPSSSSSTSENPSAIPTKVPTASPTTIPTHSPTSYPTAKPTTATPTTLRPTLSPTNQPTQSDNSEYILLTELISKIRAKFQGLITPDNPSKSTPPIPDTNQFTVDRPAGAICEGSDRAISIDIGRDGISTLNLTICALLEFELGGSFDASGLLSAVEDSLDVNLSGEFTLKGALMFGARLRVVNNQGAVTATIEFDPISIELAVKSNLEVDASFGMLELQGNGEVDLFGKAELAYCSRCNGTYGNFSRVSNTSSFYFDRLFSYKLSSSIALSADVPGVELDTGLTLNINDDNVFDDIPPTIDKPNSQALRDLLKFSPENALTMLRLIDGEYSQKYTVCFHSS